MAEQLFTARPAEDGTDTVILEVDARTALDLAFVWHAAHGPLGLLPDEPRDAGVHGSLQLQVAAALAHSQVGDAVDRFRYVPITRPALRLVAGGETS